MISELQIDSLRKGLSEDEARTEVVVQETEFHRRFFGMSKHLKVVDGSADNLQLEKWVQIEFFQGRELELNL